MKMQEFETENLNLNLNPNENNKENKIGNNENENNESEPQDFNKERFLVELEFVQCLANPWYINYLAQQAYFDQPEFRNYCAYLLSYWSKPEYSKYIIYPNCLAFLDLLCKTDSFADAMKLRDEATRVHEIQYYHWANQHLGTDKSNKLKDGDDEENKEKEKEKS